MFDPTTIPGGGDAAARRSVFEREAMPHLDFLYHAALRLTRNDEEARDLLQETMLRALRFFHLFQPGTNCRAWLLTILRNNHRNGWRHGGRELVAQSAEDFDHNVAIESIRSASWVSNPEMMLCARTVGGAIGAALDSLPADFRSVLMLIDVHEYNYAEAAGMLGVPTGTIKSRVSRGRAMMRHALARLARTQGLAAKRPRLRFSARPFGFAPA